jgi:hypothetical protein
VVYCPLLRGAVLVKLLRFTAVRQRCTIVPVRQCVLDMRLTDQSLGVNFGVNLDRSAWLSLDNDIQVINTSVQQPAEQTNRTSILLSSVFKLCQHNLRPSTS